MRKCNSKREPKPRAVQVCGRCGRKFEGVEGTEYGPCCFTLDDLRDNDRWLDPDE